MVTKKNVFVMVLVFLMVAGIVSAGAVARGGFGAGAVVAEDSDDSTVRPIQRWQDLDADELAACPCIGGDGEFDQEAFDARQAERAAWREEVQSQAVRGSLGRQGKASMPVASYGPNRAPVQGRSLNARPGMMGAQPVSGAAYGPAWAR